MEIVLTVLEAIASVALIVIVLLQSGKEAGLSGAIGGGSDTYLSKGKGKNMDVSCSIVSDSLQPH